MTSYQRCYGIGELPAGVSVHSGNSAETATTDR